MQSNDHSPGSRTHVFLICSHATGQNIVPQGDREAKTPGVPAFRMRGARVCLRSRVNFWGDGLLRSRGGRGVPSGTPASSPASCRLCTFPLALTRLPLSLPSVFLSLASPSGEVPGPVEREAHPVVLLLPLRGSDALKGLAPSLKSSVCKVMVRNVTPSCRDHTADLQQPFSGANVYSEARLRGSTVPDVARSSQWDSGCTCF